MLKHCSKPTSRNSRALEDRRLEMMDAYEDLPDQTPRNSGSFLVLSAVRPFQLSIIQNTIRPISRSEISVVELGPYEDVFYC